MALLDLTHHLLLLDFECRSINQEGNVQIIMKATSVHLSLACLKSNIIISKQKLLLNEVGLIYFRFNVFKQIVMQISQLQALTEQCHQLLKEVNSVRTAHSEESSIQALTRLIKERKQQISEIKHDLKIEQIQVKKKKQLNQYISAAQNQIRNIRLFSNKQKMQKKKLQEIFQKTREKMICQKQREKKILEEEQTMKQFDQYIEESILNKEKYEALLQQLKGISEELISDKIVRKKIIKSREEQLKVVKKNSMTIDEKIQYFNNQIHTQQVLINQINHMGTSQIVISPTRQQDMQHFSILKREEEIIFNKKGELDMWQKHQISNLMQKKEFQREKESRKIGSIYRQRFNTQYKQQKAINNRMFNYSADLKQISSKQKSIKIQQYPHLISNDRLRQLERNKRIRTRYNELKIPIAKEKSVINRISQSQQHQHYLPEEKKPSILTLYEQFKKQRTGEGMSTVKLNRYKPKKKIYQESKGVPVQTQQFD